MSNDEALVLYVLFVAAAAFGVPWVARRLLASTLRRVTVVLACFYIIGNLFPILTWAEDVAWFPAILNIIGAVGVTVAIFLVSGKYAVESASLPKRRSSTGPREQEGQ